MTNRIFTLVCLLLVVFHFQVSFAQDDLSLDDAFAADPVTPPPTTDNTVVPPDTTELNLDSPMDASTDPVLNPTPDAQDSANPLDTMVDTQPTPNLEDSPQTAMQTVTDPNDQSENVNLASAEEMIKRENALYGFSVGLIVTSMSLHEKYDVGPIAGLPDYKVPSVDRESAAIQSAGIIVRYAIAPFYSLGTDINVSFTKSQNHKNVTINGNGSLAEVNTLKGELNLMYAINLGGHLPIYFLAGFGAERVTGGSVANIIQREGYGGQAGGGFAIASALNIEAVYSYYVHRLSQRVHDDYVVATSPGSIDMEEARTVNQGLNLRTTYSF